ncbi:DNA-3-methyladenine glycosylase 2 family protein [Micromonospora craniellae]|uniref:DNA-3-methyladenine glycosylase 2 family protein n=1 Tax=Micromonospora craniellae TaxID=2294034 RepID=A0A372G5C0_9ACTN|nr:AlkA N-terminal domain-containing protein [Micromonospora craniellae]QOC90415.1 DNA-3-methyladenine glycosylase 2 family protein [Micromonospora craniellae]RFS48193.1 DNA-3-methyladenine glycosylase 2 family protein [Micromonospora craniellae]
MELDFERCYRAVDSRDQRFDGWFYTGVTSTGIYCRPSCPAVTPKRRNVRFFPSSAAAQRAGLRACRRCRPDASPGSPEWDARADVVGRAMRLIADGVVDRDGVPGLAARLGYTERHLHRMLRAELGAGPLALARAQRAQSARTLIETTGLGLAEIAFAAGFGSVRQFNDTVRDVFGVPPSQLRSARKPATGGAGTVTVRLAYRPPLHAAALLDFLARRTLPGVDEVRDGTYHRGLRLPHGPGEAVLTPADGYVLATLRLTDLRDLAPAVARCRHLFDLDADPVAVDQTLGADPALAEAVAAEPGIRVPRAVDGFETAVRAIATQQVSLASARTTLTRLLAAIPDAPPADDRVSPGDRVSPAGAVSPGDRAGAGDGDRGTDRLRDRPGWLRGFPTAEEVLRVPDAGFRMPVGRRETIRRVARAVVDGGLDLAPGGDRQETTRRLAATAGIGPWTTGYLAMRVLGDPDAFLPTDLAVRRGAAALGLPDDPTTLDAYAAAWRPWRSYAVIRLWRAA